MPSAPGGTPPGGMGAGMGGTPWGGAGGGTGPPTGKDERTAHVQEKDYFSLTSQFVNLKRFNPKGFEKKMMCARCPLRGRWSQAQAGGLGKESSLSGVSSVKASPKARDRKTKTSTPAALAAARRLRRQNLFFLS